MFWSPYELLCQLQKTNYCFLNVLVDFQSHVVGSPCQRLTGESREWQQVGSPVLLMKLVQFAV